jgi:hypothetical protein
VAVCFWPCVDIHTVVSLNEDQPGKFGYLSQILYRFHFHLHFFVGWGGRDNGIHGLLTGFYTLRIQAAFLNRPVPRKDGWDQLFLYEVTLTDQPSENRNPDKSQSEQRCSRRVGIGKSQFPETRLTRTWAAQCYEVKNNDGRCDNDFG